MAKSEGLSTEQLQSIWDGLYKEARRTLELKDNDQRKIGVRLVRPEVIRGSESEEWMRDRILVDKTDHLVSRVLLIGIDEKEIKEGKLTMGLEMGQGYLAGTKLLRPVWNGQALGLLVLKKPIEAVDYPWYIRFGDNTSVEVTKNIVLFVQLFPFRKGLESMSTSIPAALPVGFKEVFNRKTGMMIERP
jgi:hypothetical protein